MKDESKIDYGTLIAKKSERLVTGLYLVTDLIVDTEPIKQGLRKSAVILLSSMNALAQNEIKVKVTEFKTSLKSVTEILSLLHVAITTGLVSDMNGSILMDGFRSLQLVLEKKQPIFTKDMLSVDDEEHLNDEPTRTNTMVSTSYDVLTPLTLSRMNERKAIFENKKIIQKMSDINQFSKSVSEIDSEIEKMLGGQKQKDKPEAGTYHRQNTIRPISSFTTSFQIRKQSRKEQILALFAKGVDISIKDISARIKGCSEKTIQRELNTLVSDRILQRIGEKRWSRYVLK